MQAFINYHSKNEPNIKLYVDYGFAHWNPVPLPLKNRYPLCVIPSPHDLFPITKHNLFKYLDRPIKGHIARITRVLKKYQDMVPKPDSDEVLFHFCWPASLVAKPNICVAFDDSLNVRLIELRKDGKEIELSISPFANYMLADPNLNTALKYMDSETTVPMGPGKDWAMFQSLCSMSWLTIV